MPPLSVADMAPLDPPKQDTFVVVNILTDGPELSLIFTMFDEVHPFPSVILTVYEPAPRPVAVEAFPPLGDHVYVKGGVAPPVRLTEPAPFMVRQVEFVKLTTEEKLTG